MVTFKEVRIRENPGNTKTKHNISTYRGFDKIATKGICLLRDSVLPEEVAIRLAIYERTTRHRRQSIANIVISSHDLVSPNLLVDNTRAR